jgi:pyrrolidone-carboxylate peptidase
MHVQDELNKDLQQGHISYLPVQRKLSIGAVDDPLEDEADAMADKVMRMPETNFVQRKCSHCEEEDEKLQRKPETSFVQRKCSHCEEEDEKVQRKPETNFVQRKCAHCEEEETVNRKALTSFIQRKESARNVATTDAISNQVNSTRGNGSMMDAETKGFMESRFGADFSAVKIHTGNEAAQMSRDIQAKAFTTGNDIYFNEGQYQPGSSGGKHLLAHELTHTIQQTGGIAQKIQRQWDKPGTNCPDADLKGGKKWLQLVVVQQEIPQFVTLHWSDGTSETGMCSSGKGHCCTETSDAVACDTKTSNQKDTNCTPITKASGFNITDRILNNGGWEFWNTFVPSRSIALHTHHTVNGEPLSHGCVRLNRETARRIFCGAKQNRTRVQVQGFSRPSCSSPAIIAEWLDEIRYIQTDPKGDRDLERGIKEVREWMRHSYGVKNDEELDKLVAGLNAGNIVSKIPKCGSKSALAIPANSTPEESRVFSESINVNQFSLVFAKEIIAFIQGLRTAGDLAAAKAIVTSMGQGLWDRATARAQTGIDKQPVNIDDRALYWTRLRMIEEIRRFKSLFTITDAERQQLIDLLELSARGEKSVDFTGAGSKQKKILISGFDPFGLTGAPSSAGTNMTILDSNPSGAAVLALDGQSITGGSGLSAFVQGVIFPVRYRDFDAGMIENLFRPFLDGTTPLSMIMTISQGSSSFDIERWAGRRRSTSGFDDNEGKGSGGSATNPVEPPGISTGPEFLETKLPHSQMSKVPQTALHSTGWQQLPNKQAVAGTGGGFLSNEIFYRVRLLQTNIGGKMAKIPVGHLHVPTEDTAGMSRETIKDRIVEILRASLPVLP